MFYDWIYLMWFDITESTRANEDEELMKMKCGTSSNW